jgi:hypothetical protein
MICISRPAYTWWLLLAVLTSTSSLRCQQAVQKKSVLDSPVDENAAVRFFYNPSNGGYFHFPLIFRPVAPEDPRLNTAPMSTEGRTAYISLSEMRQLLQGLRHSDLSWQESEKVEILGSFKKLAITDSMEVTVVSSQGTAKAAIDAKKICDTLKPLDSALKAPRGLWEFQLFRQGYGCQVPGFNFEAYPDHSH